MHRIRIIIIEICIYTVHPPVCIYTVHPPVSNRTSINRTSIIYLFSFHVHQIEICQKYAICAPNRNMLFVPNAAKCYLCTEQIEIFVHRIDRNMLFCTKYAQNRKMHICTVRVEIKTLPSKLRITLSQDNQQFTAHKLS